MNKRLLGAVTEPLEKAAERTESQRADRGALGEAPLLEPIAERQIQPVEEFTAEQGNRVLERLDGCGRDIAEQVPDRCQIDDCALRFKGHSRAVGFEPDRPAEIQQRPDLGKAPP